MASPRLLPERVSRKARVVEGGSLVVLAEGGLPVA